MWRSADMSLWRGRSDLADGARALRWHQQVRAWDGSEALAGRAALLGFCCDEGVRRNQGRCGAARGPQALRAALANATVPGPWAVFDGGDVCCDDGQLESAQGLFGERLRGLLDAGAFVLTLGGGHEIAWGSFQGIAAHLGERSAPRVGILNFDAHFDLRNPRDGASSGTPFRQVADWCEQRSAPFAYRVLGINPIANSAALFDTARARGVRWVEDTECVREELPRLRGFVDELVGACDVLYLSVCLDVFAAACAPGVSAPAALGIEAALVIALIRHCGLACRRRGVRWLVGEVAELNPERDIDQRTARLAARIAHEIVAAATTGEQQP